MKRPILIITLGILTGIIVGLYLNIAPFVFCVLIFGTIIFKIVNFRSKTNYMRILKVFIKNNIILLFFISACVSSIYLINCRNNYEKIYREFNSNTIVATVISNKDETEYKYSYKIRLEEYEGINFILRISKNKGIELECGDKILIKGEYIVPEEAKNYGGFNYKEYLKTQKICGIFEGNNIEIICKNNVEKVELLANKLKQKIINNTNKILPENTRDLFLGILIGYDDNLSINIQESFRKSGLTHLLAVSGAHIVYIIAGISFLFIKFRLPKKVALIFTIVFLIFFMYVTEFSSSVVRAAIMGIVLLFSFLIYRKVDILTSISVSILVIILENPYKILNIGFILSYLATIGIICFSKFRNKKSEEEVNWYIKLTRYLKELISVTVFANICVIPIMIYNFNTVSLVFIISNLVAGVLIGPITIGGFILAIIILINTKVAYIFAIPYNILLELLIKSTYITSAIPLSEILVPTPSQCIIIIYYIFLLSFILYLFIKKEYSSRYLVKKSLMFIFSLREMIKKKFKLILVFFLFLIILINLISKIIPKDLKIYFIDVGQGDSTLVVTPTNKRILIDSGGSENGDFDVGKNTLVPYLLDRRIIYLDYICISHFDSDHCDGFIYLLNNIMVKNIIISKQYEVTDNFKKIMKIVKRKNINILKVEARNVLQIDKYVKFNILSPGKVLTDDINNNSIVMKLEYNNFSCLFTGDISKYVEQKLVKEYGNMLKSTVLKVAHHGSKTSSDENFIKVVNPKISLIGVGKNNKFGHPNEEVIDRLQKLRCENL